MEGKLGSHFERSRSKLHIDLILVKSGNGGGDGRGPDSVVENELNNENGGKTHESKV